MSVGTTIDACIEKGGLILKKLKEAYICRTCKDLPHREAVMVSIEDPCEAEEIIPADPYIHYPRKRTRRQRPYKI